MSNIDLSSEAVEREAVALERLFLAIAQRDAPVLPVLMLRALSAALAAKEAEAARLREERDELRQLLVGLGAGIPAAAILKGEARAALEGGGDG